MLFETMISTTKNSSNQAGKLIREILNIQDFRLKKNIYYKKNIYFEEKNEENKNNSKEL